MKPTSQPTVTNTAPLKHTSRGGLCIRNGSLYQCTSEITTPEAWNSSHWKRTSLTNINNNIYKEVNELDNNLGGFTPVIDDTGKITGYKTSIGGADTVFPFSGSVEGKAEYILYYQCNSNDNPELTSGSITIKHDCVGWGRTSSSSVRPYGQYIKVNDVSVISGNRSSGVFTAKEGDVVSWYGYCSAAGRSFVIVLLY